MIKLENSGTTCENILSKSVSCYLLEADNGYSFYYDKDYIEIPIPKPISSTLSEETYQSNVLFPFFDGLIPEGWLLYIGKNIGSLIHVTDLNY